tara:strand:- start:193 stop:375 length:183 start_codon:yes stop_codon:yes gene_type:complete
MAVEQQILFISYITLAAVIAMVYGLRRIFLLEKKIVSLEKTILGKKRKTAKKKTKKKKRR